MEEQYRVPVVLIVFNRISLVEKLLQTAERTGELQLDDARTAAAFCVYGQLGILLADDLTQQEKMEKIRTFLLFALRL